MQYFISLLLSVFVYPQMLTDASGLPVKNFLICLDVTICAGLTGGSRIQGLPAIEKKSFFHSSSFSSAVAKIITSPTHVQCRRNRLSYCIQFLNIPSEFLAEVCSQFWGFHPPHLQHLNCLPDLNIQHVTLVSFQKVFRLLSDVHKTKEP